MRSEWTLNTLVAGARLGTIFMRLQFEFGYGRGTEI